MAKTVDMAMSSRSVTDPSTLVFRPLTALVTLSAIVALGIAYPPGLVFLSLIVTLVVLHEIGHWSAARRAGMAPTELFAGMGPVVVSWRRGACTYGVKAIMIGGYVKIPGMTPREEIDPALEPFTFRAATRRRRLVVILAGVTVNAGLALGLFCLAGLNDTLHHTQSTTYHQASHETAAIAVEGIASTRDVAVGTLNGLGQLTTNVGGYTSSLTGDTAPPVRFLSPVGASQVTAVAAHNGLSVLLRFAAILSISLAVFNLLPFVPLDGGHAAIILGEWFWSAVTRRQHRFDANRLNPVAYGLVGFMLFLSASSLYLDLARPIPLP